MPILDDADLATLREVEEDNLPHRCALQSPQAAETDTGGTVTTWVTYALAVRCRLTTLSGTEIPRGALLTPETNYLLVMPYGQPVAAADRAVVSGTTKGVEWLQTVGVVFVAAPKATSARTSAYCTDKVEQV